MWEFRQVSARRLALVFAPSLFLSCGKDRSQDPTPSSSPASMQAFRNSGASKQAALLVAEQSNVEHSVWLSDFGKAKRIAALQKRPILLRFAGSDWCPPCQRMNAEIFLTSQFRDYAKHHLVLVDVDFPRQAPQTDRQRMHNSALAEQYGVEAFPVSILVNPEGREMGRIEGYFAGGVAPFLKAIRNTIEATP